MYFIFRTRQGRRRPLGTLSGPCTVAGIVVSILIVLINSQIVMAGEMSGVENRIDNDAEQIVGRRMIRLDDSAVAAIAAAASGVMMNVHHGGCGRHSIKQVRRRRRLCPRRSGRRVQVVARQGQIAVSQDPGTVSNSASFSARLRLLEVVVVRRRRRRPSRRRG